MIKDNHNHWMFPHSYTDEWDRKTKNITMVVFRYCKTCYHVSREEIIATPIEYQSIVEELEKQGFRDDRIPF